GGLSLNSLRCWGVRGGSPFPHPVALALGGDDGGVLGQAVEQRRGELLVSAENARPLAEGEIGGDEHAAASVSGSEHVEQELTALAVKGHEANLVDDEQVDALEAAHVAPELLG